jgi:IS1 family transposase
LGQLGPNYGEMVFRWSSLCSTIPAANQDSCRYLFWNCCANRAQTMVEWSFGGHLSELCPRTLLNFLVLVTVAILVGGRGLRTQFWKMTIERPFHHSLGLIGTVVSEEIIFKLFWKFSKKSLTHYLLWNCWAKWAQTMVEWSLGYPLSEFCPTAPVASQVVRITKNRKFDKVFGHNSERWPSKDHSTIVWA